MLVKKIGLWATYGLTFKGRITVAKSLLLSQYTYAATILDSNDKTLTDKIQSQLDYFIFQNKRGSAENPNFSKPDFHLLNLKLINLCLKGKIETRLNRLSKIFGPQVNNWFGIKQLQSFISSLPKKEPLKFPSLPIQSPPDEGWFWEELSDLFVNTVRGGKN